jgi:integrase
MKRNGNLKRRGNSEGTIIPYRGRWAAAIDLGWHDGHRKRKWVYGDTRAAVADQLNALLVKRRQNLPVAFERQTVEQYLTGWLASVKPPIVRPRTYERFEGIVRLHLAPTLGRLRLEKLQPSQVQELLSAKLKAGLSLQSVKHIKTTLSIALNRAVKWDILARNVASLTELPTIERKPVTPLTPDDARKLLDCAAGDRLEALYSVALAIGLRRGEALGLTWDDVALDGDVGSVRVNQSLQRAEGKLQLLPPKTSTSRRTISLPDMAVRALRKHRARQNEERLALGAEWKDTGLIFTTRAGGPLEPRNVDRSFKSLLKRAGLSPSRFHDLRHTSASLLLAQGVHPRIVMEILGHSRIALTMDTYSHVMPSVMNEAAAKMDAILSR